LETYDIYPLDPRNPCFKNDDDDVNVDTTPKNEHWSHRFHGFLSE